MSSTLSLPCAMITLVLSEPGEYMVCFEAIDSSGRKTSLEYGITAVSWEKPEISLSRGDRSGSVGKSIKIASASVADGVALYTYIEFPNGKIVPIKSHAFVTSEAGTYKVRYIAYDESGNMNDVSYAVTVS